MKRRYHVCVRPTKVEESDHRHACLLRARRERPSCYTAAEKCDEFPPPHAAYPKAKDHGTKYSRCWDGSVARIAIKGRSMTTPSGKQVVAIAWPIIVCVSIQAQAAALVWNGPASECAARPIDRPTKKHGLSSASARCSYTTNTMNSFIIASPSLACGVAQRHCHWECRTAGQRFRCLQHQRGCDRQIQFADGRTPRPADAATI